MVDSAQPRRDRRRKDHDIQHRSHLKDSSSPCRDKASKGSSDSCTLPERDEDSHRSHHHKRKKHKYDKNEDRDGRLKHRRKNGPRDRSETHHLVCPKEEPLTPESDTSRRR